MVHEAPTFMVAVSKAKYKLDEWNLLMGVFFPFMLSIDLVLN
jgi:hypothetical protein